MRNNNDSQYPQGLSDKQPAKKSPFTVDSGNIVWY